VTPDAPHPRRSHGTGRWSVDELATFGEGSLIEADVLVFQPDHVAIGRGVYVGHLTILKGYHRNRLVIGDGTWIGEQCFLHAAGGITIGRNVGIGPGVRIITSRHAEAGRETPILHSPLDFAPVAIGDDADLGIGSTVLPGVTIGRGVQVGAGAVVARDLPDYAVAAGVPARVMRIRPAAARIAANERQAEP
jgi:acetyltransferase-like isoleucine patch superfamily enzyme